MKSSLGIAHNDWSRSLVQHNPDQVNDSGPYDPDFPPIDGGLLLLPSGSKSRSLSQSGGSLAS